MTKLDWDKANHRMPDPGSMIEAPEDFSTPENWKPPSKVRAAARARAKAEQEAREREQAKKRAKARAYAAHKATELAILRKAKVGEPLDPAEQTILNRLLADRPKKRATPRGAALNLTKGLGAKP